ncbi:MAG TPA: hypothetical protein DCL29_01840 [Eubacterium sp.]|nr:hypothetical protein [Eubacterium sp.]
MRLFKKTLSIITVLSLAFSTPVFAEDGGEISDGDTRIDIAKFSVRHSCNNDTLFTVDEKTKLITSVDASLMEETVMVIPSKVKASDGSDIDIVGIGDSAFKNMDKLEKIYLPDDFETFGKECFMNDKNLKEMMPYKAEQEFTYAEYKLATDPEAQLGDDDALNNQKMIGFNYKEESENSGDLDNPGNPENTENMLYPDLQGFYLPTALVNVDATAFIGCEKITRFDYNLTSDEEETGLTIAGVKITPATEFSEETREVTNELLLTKDGKKLICMAPGFSGDKYSFTDHGAETIEEIGNYACYNNKTNNGFIIPKSVKKIGDYAFYGCTNQNSYAFEEGSVLESIGAYAYANTVNLNISFPETFKTMGVHAFDSANNAVIDISKSQVEVIPEYAFANQPTLHELTTPKTLKTIAPYAFANSTNLDTIHFLGETLESIGKGAFEGCRTLHVIDIPEGVKAIEEDTFNGCSNLGIVILPESLEEIGANAFKDCVTIHEMVIPAGVKYVDKTSFSGARIDKIDTSKNEALSKLFGRNFETEEQKAAKLMNKVLTINGYKYKVTKTDKTGGEVQLIGAADKKKVKKLKKLVVKNTVAYTFEGKNYTYKVTSIGAKAFKGYKKLAKVTIGTNVTTIGKAAFYNCKKLKNVVIKSKNITKIGKKAFRRNGAKKLTVKVPKKLKKKYNKLLKKAKTNKYKVK